MRRSNPYDINDLYRLLYRFDQKTRWLWKIFPVIQLTRVTVICTATSKKILKKKWVDFKMWLRLSKKDWYTKYSSVDFLNADVIIAYSSPKPSWYPALEELGSILSSQKVTCCIVTSINTASTFHHVPDQHYFCQLPFYKLSRYITLIEKFVIILNSSMALLIVLVAISFSGKTRTLIQRLPYFFLEMVECHKRIIYAKMLISKTRPRLLITNGEHVPYCSELMYAANIYGLWRIWFYNEWPASGFIPFLSNEVWTWNYISSKAIRAVLPWEKNILVTIVGRAEADYVEHIYSDSKIDDDLEWIDKSSLPILILILDYNGNPDRKNVQITERIMKIMRETAIQCMDWRFLIKPKPFQCNLPIPGDYYLKELPNCRIIRKKTALGPFLLKEQVKVAAGCISSGLLTAAAYGKLSVRLIIESLDYPLDYVDSVSLKIRTAEELIKLLKQISEGKTYRIIENEKDMFPYKGKVVIKMKDVVMERLKEAN